MHFATRLATLWLFVSVIDATDAVGYEFEISARTVGQGYQLRWYQPGQQDRLLNRRRLTQLIGVDVWNILEPRFDARRPSPPPLAPFELYFTSSLRIDHDFGDYADDQLIYATGPSSTTSAPVTTAVPELAAQRFGLELLYAYVGVRGLFGILDAELGRQLLIDGLDWFALDGLRMTVRLPLRLALEGHAGLLVRDSSPLGSSVQEPDGSASADCLTFAADEGVFQPVTRCRQREALAPTFGVALATRGMGAVVARLSYRRTVSATASGLYPDLRGEAPGWGVLEEKFAATLRTSLWDGGLVPWAAARWNLLLGLVDEAHVGARVALGSHALSAEALYSYPSFDGDSIFNVFSAEPYWDTRLTWDVWPGQGRLRGTARVFFRHYQNDERGLAPDAMVAAHTESLGAALGARWSAGRRGFLRLDLYYEDGFGGLRAGGDLSGRWRLGERYGIEGRISVVRLEEDSLPDRAATTLGVQAGGRVVLGPGMTLHLLAEENSNRYDRNQLRLMAILDLAFQPEH